MRIIFRAWLKDENKMVEVTSLNLTTKRIMYDIYKMKSFDEIILMQSTSLKDKNGKEIFEGDIINIHQTVNGENLFVITIDSIDGIVPVYNFNRTKKYEYDVKELLEVNERDKEIEVVGNIYENKELIENE